MSRMTEAPKPVQAGLQIYQVDDGCSHWVIAASLADAVEVYREAEMEPDAPYNDPPPEVLALTSESAAALSFFDEDGNRVGSLFGEFQRDPSRRYIGCSEW